MSYSGLMRFDADFKQRLKAQALSLGFSDCGVTTANDLGAATEAHFLEWLARGYHDRMTYLERQPLSRARPQELLDDARSVICLTVAYRSGGWEAQEGPAPDSTGRIARYARGEDYHEVIAPRLAELEKWLRLQGGEGVRTRKFCDAGPLMERAFAERAGLGFIGRNGLLITPRHGSWVLLAAIVTNLEIETDAPGVGSCHNCRRCLDACPTGALVAPHVLDARKCISNLTIERRGDFTPAEESAIVDWVFGCDICQEVCPYNKGATVSSYDGLNAPHFPEGILLLADLAELKSNREFERRFKNSPLLRARLKGILRNAKAVMTNQRKEAAMNRP